jgi:tetratricopeptide (TPR) repeat protein
MSARPFERVAFVVGLVAFGASLAGGLALLVASKQPPGFAPDPLRKARASLRSGHTTAAITEYQAAAAIAPEFHGLAELAFAHSQAGNALGEIDACTRALQLRPDTSGLRLGLASALAKQGRLYEAAASFEEGLLLDPGHPMGHAGLGEVRLAQHRVDLAIASLSRAAELAPDDASVRGHLGQAFLLGGRNREAVVQLETAYRLAPEPARLTSLRHARQTEDAALAALAALAAATPRALAVGIAP